MLGVYFQASLSVSLLHTRPSCMVTPLKGYSIALMSAHLPKDPTRPVPSDDNDDVELNVLGCRLTY